MATRRSAEPAAPASEEPQEVVPPLGADYVPDAGLPFDAGELERRIVWMWGSPRSGSTWLLRQLCHPLEPDPESVTVFRTPERDAGPYDAIPIDESFISNHLAPAFADPREADGAYVPGTINNYLGNRPVYAYSQAYAEIWRPEARRSALVRLHGFLYRARQQGVSMTDAPQLVIKEVNGSHAADLVMSLMPRSRLLFLVRDGRDVVDSLLAAYAPGGFLARHQGRAFDTPEERAEGLRWAALLWTCNVDMTLRAMDSHPPELATTVRYEDLLADPIAEMTRLYSWMGLERSAERVERMAVDTSFSKVPSERKGERERHRSAKPGLWRENLSEAEQRTALEIMGSRLERLGYETD